MSLEKTKDIAVLEKKINTSLAFAESIIITTDEEMLAAGKFRSEIKEYAKTAEEEKKKATAPIQESLKTIRSWFAPIEETSDKIVAIVGKKMQVYSDAQDAIRRKAEEAARKKEEDIRKAQEAGKITEAQAEKKLEKVEEKLEEAPVVITKSADFHTRIDRKVRFTQPNMLTIQNVALLVSGGYLVWDEVKGRKDALSGMLAIGVEVYEEKNFI